MSDVRAPIVTVTDLVKRLGESAAAVETASRLRESESRAARWVASDALRELESDAVLARMSRG